MLIKPIVDEARAAHAEAYARTSWAEHEASVRRQFRLLLKQLAQRHPPTLDDLDWARALGRTRARQGLPLEAVLGAFHHGYRGFWELVASRAESGALSRETVDLLMASLQMTSAAIANGYTDVARARDELQIDLGHQLLDALYGGRTVAEETTMLARALGFDNDGMFQAASCLVALMAPELIDQLRWRLRDHGGAQCVVVRGPMLVVLSQGIPERRIVQLLDSGDGRLAVGLGLPRSGLGGATESLLDAERALAVAQQSPEGGIVSFRSSWLLATLLPHAERLGPLLDAGKATNQPHLYEAVRAYADHGFSIAATAEALHLHPNSVKYRLDRWQQLTGWDPRTLEGAQRSLLSIALAERQPPPASATT
ncbi:PucR family transcriptional regulator [Rugosimonospora acidiphila]|uniref:PucR family transcriptional regulator n=1 Tax=Rugosimonospora acidiphila TaxID=556531 RepID=UPI0031EC0D41